MWRLTVGAASVYLLMTSLVAAIDTLNDDMPPGDIGFLFQNQNYIEPGMIDLTLPELDSAVKSLVLYKMLTAMRNQAVPPNVLAGPKWMPSVTELEPSDAMDLTLLKESMKKRGSEADGVGSKDKAVVGKTPARKGNPKNGRRVGSHMICYFKLCAFRPPSA